LRAAGYEPWVGATSRRTYAARSRAAAGTIALPYSGSEPAAFCDRLGAAVERLGVTVVLPGSEPDLIAISRAPDSALRSAAGVPGLDVVLRITDKTAVYRLATELGLQVPDTKVIDRERLLEVPTAEFPVIVKPVRSALAQPGGGLVRADARLVTSRDQLRWLIDELEDGGWLVQSRLAGQLGAVSGVALAGQVVTAVHQVSRRVWPPGAGVSALAETVPADSALEGDVARLIDGLGWSGIFQAQFIHDDHGPHLIDLNPRVYGSLALATAAGVNLPAIWAALVTGSQVEPTIYQVGVRYRSEELDPRALLDLAMHGRPLAAWKGVLPRRHTAHSVLTLRDPAPGLTSLGKLGRHIRDAVRPRRSKRRLRPGVRASAPRDRA
jgi:predicted ATP-grasp superfamily ATP-dependent carboligase